MDSNQRRGWTCVKMGKADWECRFGKLMDHSGQRQAMTDNVGQKGPKFQGTM